MERETDPFVSAEESVRLEALRLHDLKSGENEAAFDELARLAAVLLDAPTAFFSLVDRDRIHFKARFGSAVTEAPREGSFCAATIAGEDILVVPDATLDERFRRHPMVTGEEKARFYAGVPVRTAEGYKVATLGVIDRRPRELAERERDALRSLAGQAGAQLELRRQAAQLRFQQALLELARIDLSHREIAVPRIIETSAGALEVERTGLWFFDETRTSIVVEDLFLAGSRTHTSGERLTAADYPTYFAALAESRTIAAADAATDPRTCEFYTSYLAPNNVRAMLDVPVRSEGRVVGIICYEHTGTPRVWSPNEQAYAASTADLLGTVIEASRRRRIEEDLRRLTATLERRVEERTADLENSNRDLGRALRDLEAFSYSVSHDLRAPLRVINGFASILEDADGAAGDEVREAVARIRGNTARMSELIDDMLSFFRLGRRPLTIGTVDMNALVREVIEMLGLDDLAVAIELGDLAPAEGDKALLGDVLANLLGNATKFSARSDEPRIEVGCERGTDEVVYFVRDNGVGFHPEHASKLFQPFYRLHAAEGFEGSGVGLAIVHRIVDRHGGRVWAESTPGRGAAFFFSLPLRSVLAPSSSD